MESRDCSKHCQQHDSSASASVLWRGRIVCSSPRNGSNLPYRSCLQESQRHAAREVEATHGCLFCGEKSVHIPTYCRVSMLLRCCFSSQSLICIRSKPTADWTLMRDQEVRWFRCSSETCREENNRWWTTSVAIPGCHRGLERKGSKACQTRRKNSDLECTLLPAFATIQ